MTDTGFKYFRSTTTGLVGRYPAHFGFLADLVEVDPDEGVCTDCTSQVEDDAPETDNDDLWLMELTDESEDDE